MQQACFSGYAAARRKQIDRGLKSRRRAVQGDALLLAELCANLLDNAINAARHGDRTAAAKVLEIEDSGPGIAADQQRQALQPFGRLDHASQPGAGIGLALVQDICAARRSAAAGPQPAAGRPAVTVSFR